MEESRGLASSCLERDGAVDGHGRRDPKLQIWHGVLMGGS